MVVHTTEAKLEFNEIDGNEKLVNQYTIGNVLGSGGYATVRECKDKNGKYAIKIMSRSFLKKQHFPMVGGAPGKYISALQHAKDEQEFLSEIEHENLIELIEVIDSEEQDSFYFITDLCEGGEIMTWSGKSFEIPSKVKKIKPFKKLKKKVHTFTPEMCKLIISDVANALKYLHDNGIVHFDIKPANILLTKEGKLKLCDFGCARRIKFGEDGEEQKLIGYRGTDQFTPPEIMLEDHSFHGPPCDVWALGCCLYAFATSKLPFYDQNILKLYDLIREADLKVPSSVDKETSNIIGAMLSKDPYSRITVENLLASEWLQATTKK